MGLKQRIENNLLIYTIIIFFIGVTSTWFIIEKLWIGPKDIIIEQLKMGINKEEKPSIKTESKQSTTFEDSDKTNAKSSARFERFTPSIYYDINEDNVDEIISQIRGENKLRELSALESGKSISELPMGTYFYLSYIYLEKINRGLENLYNVRSVDRYKLKNSYYEIHYLRDGKLNLLGYISSAGAGSASILNGNEEKKLTVFPTICEEANNLVIIPFNRILSLDYREITFDSKVSSFAYDLVIK
ncbi:MAG: hypothetical protein ACXADW_23050 [Candidatus Hodarchaeales archaeon]|jgi:hypothetical protein